VQQNYLGFQCVFVCIYLFYDYLCASNLIQRTFKHKDMSDKLDKIDLRILQILQENSKITNLDLSKKIGLSPAPTLERVKKLEQSDVIQSYHAVVNPLHLGLNVKTFLSKILEIPEIVECYIITGEADFLMKVVCKDIPTYEQLLFKTLSQIEEIERLRTLMTLSTVKDSKILPFDYEEGM
jgi:Lrp/AsnC family transcriptional regulator, leucine-responsive regulatory protein